MKDSKTKETGYGKYALMKGDLSSSETQVSDNIKLSVRPVVCDYGIYENDKLISVINNRFNALLIKAILTKDIKFGQGLSGTPQFSIEDFQALLDTLTGEQAVNGRQ